jgi:hypothetical protein
LLRQIWVEELPSGHAHTSVSPGIQLSPPEVPAVLDVLDVVSAPMVSEASSPSSAVGHPSIRNGRGSHALRKTMPRVGRLRRNPSIEDQHILKRINSVVVRLGIEDGDAPGQLDDR